MIILDGQQEYDWRKANMDPDAFAAWVAEETSRLQDAKARADISLDIVTKPII